jgi:hypothetical protein
VTRYRRQSSHRVDESHSRRGNHEARSGTACVREGEDQSAGLTGVIGGSPLHRASHHGQTTPPRRAQPLVERNPLSGSGFWCCLEHGRERFDHVRVELRPGALVELGKSCVCRQGPLVRTIAGHRSEGVDDGDDA